MSAMANILFDHIAIGMKRMADAPAVLAGVLGGDPSFGQSSEAFRWGRSRERARRLWEVVLEGRAEDGRAGELIYRWPGSPMRLAVEIDPARDEGPVAIEFASAQRLLRRKTIEM